MKMKKLLREDELRKEYDVYRLRAIADEGVGLENLLKIADTFSKKGLIESCESWGYYLNFEDWLKEYKNIDTKEEEVTIAEILKDRRIEIDMYTRNVTQEYSINIHSMSIPFERGNLDISMEDENYDNAIDTYDVWENGAYIKSSLTEEELNEYLQELYNEYN